MNNLKNVKNARGITLVALIITIIVLLILAVVAIRAVQDGGIIQYAQNARDEYIIGQQKEVELLKNHLTFLEENASETPHIVHGDNIPLGAKYIIKNGETLESTENNYVKFPETVKDGDIYIYGDYEYRYNEYYHGGSKSWKADANQNGWGVRVKDNNVTKTAYGSILTTINRKDVTNMTATFFGCNVMEVAPAIPKTVTNLWAAFYRSKAITSAPKIPDGVVNMEMTFQECVGLTETPYIPNSVKNMRQTFSQCSKLVSVTNFPNQVENLNLTFDCCSLLKNVPDIPGNVTNMKATFQYCEALTTAPKILSDKVTDISYAFNYCNSLKGDITINAVSSKLTTYVGMFKDTTEKICLLGTDKTLLTTIADEYSNVEFKEQ